jgi:hypothetical protein
MSKSSWYRERAAESDQKARDATKPATRGRHIKDREGWLEIAASIEATDEDQKQSKSAALSPKTKRAPPSRR